MPPPLRTEVKRYIDALVAAHPAALLRLDGWRNVISRLGTSADKATHTQHARVILTRDEIDSIYECDGIGARIVDEPVEDMLREGWDFRCDDEGAGDLLDDELDRLRWRAVIGDGLRWQRLYGGSGILVGTDDGRALADPLDEAGLQEVRFLTAIDCHELTPTAWERDPLSPLHGLPTHYDWQPFEGDPATVHASRIIRLDARRLPHRVRRGSVYQGWGPGVMHQAYEALRQYWSFQRSASTIAHDFTVDVYTVAGLRGQLASNGGDEVSRRLELASYLKSVVNAIVLDADLKETFDRRTTSVAGLADLQLGAVYHLAASVQIPVRLLFGRVAGGLGDGNDSDLQRYYAHIGHQQETGGLRDATIRVIELIMRARRGPFGGREPAQWNIEFRPLWQASDKEQAEVRALHAATDEKYWQMGVVSAREVRESRFGQQAGYGSEIALIEGEDPSESAEGDGAQPRRAPGEAGAEDDDAGDDDQA